MAGSVQNMCEGVTGAVWGGVGGGKGGGGGWEAGGYSPRLFYNKKMNGIAID